MSELRNLPKIDALMEAKGLRRYPPSVRVAAARAAVDKMRRAAIEGAALAEFDAEAEAYASSFASRSLKPAINMSGVILHTGLGRARLAPAAVEHLTAVASGHSLVELDQESGERGDRQTHVRGLLTALTGAEDALVVNNAAAGVVLTLSALASGREVLLSRGEMVEIGGSFRMPDIVRQSGCKLIEVGCTNKTRLDDYESAWSEDSAAILRCHPSNFKIIGFTGTPTPESLADLAHSKGGLFIDDLGSGCLVDTTRFGLPKLPTLGDAVRSGADAVIASCDKLLGGPQGGLVLGTAATLMRIRKHPLARAMRVDKLTLAALEATLKLYRDGLELEIPTLAAMARPALEVRRAATRLAKAYPGKAAIKASITEVGGGSAPGSGVPSFCAVLYGERPEELARKLRMAESPILGRVQQDAVWLDPRTATLAEVKNAEKSLRGLEC